MPFVEIAKGRGTPFQLSYEVQGTGPIRLLCIMGLFASRVMWTEQLKFFSKLPEFSICTFDNRGAGFSGIPPGRYRTSDMAEDAYELLLHLGWTNKVNLVGVSMGGMISQELAYLHPEAFDTVTLMSTYPYQLFSPLTGTVGVLRLAVTTDQLERVNNILNTAFSMKFLNAKSNEPGFETKTNRDYVLNYLIEINKLTRPMTPEGSIRQLPAVLTHYFSAERMQALKNSHINIVVATGTDDNLVWPSNSFYMAKEMDAHLEVFEGSGHVLPVECRDAVNQLLLRTALTGPKKAGAKSFIKPLESKM